MKTIYMHRLFTSSHDYHAMDIGHIFSKDVLYSLKKEKLLFPLMGWLDIDPVRLKVREIHYVGGKSGDVHLPMSVEKLMKELSKFPKNYEVDSDVEMSGSDVASVGLTVDGCRDMTKAELEAFEHWKVVEKAVKRAKKKYNINIW